MAEDKKAKDAAKKATSGKYEGVVTTQFRAKELNYILGETYFTQDKGSFDHLVKTRRITPKTDK